MNTPTPDDARVPELDDKHVSDTDVDRIDRIDPDRIAPVTAINTDSPRDSEPFAGEAVKLTAKDELTNKWAVARVTALTGFLVALVEAGEFNTTIAVMGITLLSESLTSFLTRNSVSYED